MKVSDELRARMEADGFPPQLLEPLRRLFRIRQHINIRILPHDAYMVIGLLQFASRNPALLEEHQLILRHFANQMIEAIVNVEPILEEYLLAGWDPSQDVPIKKQEGG